MDWPSIWSIGPVFCTILCIWAAQRWRAYKQFLTVYNDLLGPRYFAYSLGFLSYRSHPPFLTPPRNSNFRAKHFVYETYGWDVISNVTFWPKPRASIWVADAVAVKELTLSRDRFVKPVSMYKLVSFFGGNIVASEGEDWKRHRKVAQPAFSEKNNKLVWDESCRIVNEMVISWGLKEAIEIDHVVGITLPIALMVIGSAGFGKRITWDEDQFVPNGHKMSFKTALSIVCKDLFLKIIIPRWASCLTQRYRNIHAAFDELKVYMEEVIEERKRAPFNEAYPKDLFSNLIRATEEEDGSELSPEELMGDTFIFLLAGHETSAHTLAFTFALLALYQDEQEILYQELKVIIRDGRMPAYEDMHLLTRSMAVFYETLRLFPPVNIIPKVAVDETTLSFGSAIDSCKPRSTQDVTRKTVRIPKNARVNIHTPGLHYNPRYWDDPHEFRPSRFLGDWPKEAFLPFSGGPRACIGRRFFETEGIATLSVLLSRYRIEVKDEPCFVGESFEAKKERILTCKAGLTLTPVRVPLVFIKRKEP